VWLKTRVYCLTFLLGLSECVWQSLHGILQPGTEHGRELEHLLGQAERGRGRGRRRGRGKRGGESESGGERRKSMYI